MRLRVIGIRAKRYGSRFRPSRSSGDLYLPSDERRSVVAEAVEAPSLWESHTSVRVR